MQPQQITAADPVGLRSVGLVGVTLFLGLQQVRNLLTRLTFYLVGALDAPVGAVVAGVVAVLARWGGLPRTVVMGDMNAEPDSPEIPALRTAGLVDAFEGSGAVRPGYISPSDGP